MSNIARIFWNGGFNSTFRILELSRYEDLTIEAIYVSTNTRNEASVLNTIKKVKSFLLSDSQFKASFTELAIINIENIPPNKAISEAFINFNKTYSIDSEIEYLARYAQARGEKIELTLENLGSAHLYKNLSAPNFEKVKKSGGRAYYVLTPDNDKDLYTLFSNFYFPASIFDMTQRDMWQRAQEKHSDSLLLKSWFCTMPIRDEPCGVCEACTKVINAKMRFRLTAKAFRRSQRIKRNPLLRNYYKVKEKIKQFITSKV